MTEQTPDERAARRRLAAGLLACDEAEVGKRVRAMDAHARANLTADINWLRDYEAFELRPAG